MARRYVQQMTANAIQGNFTIIDSIYEHKPIPDNQVAKKDSIYVWANYAIYDKDYQLKYTNSDQKKLAMPLYPTLIGIISGLKLVPETDYLSPGRARPTM